MRNIYQHFFLIFTAERDMTVHTTRGIRMHTMIHVVASYRFFMYRIPNSMHIFFLSTQYYQYCFFFEEKQD